MTLPILLVERSRYPDPDSNLHRTTYPSPPLHSAQAAQKGQFVLRGVGPSNNKVAANLLHNNHTQEAGEYLNTYEFHFGAAYVEKKNTTHTQLTMF